MHEINAQPATVTGEARRISAAEKAAIALAARPAILRATIQITRAATGKVEEYEIVGSDPEYGEGAASNEVDFNWPDMGAAGAPEREHG